ncbi:MAG: glutathione S-transferase family protein [Pseudomonadota bacterium]
MITLYAFGTIFPEGVGETRDLRVQWGLEETGVPYRVHPLDHTGGECDGKAYGHISPFRQVPVIDDDGFVVAESAAALIHIAEKSGQLMPADPPGRMRTLQWCFAAVGTVEPTMTCIDFIGMFDQDKAAPRLHEQVHGLAGRWLDGVERRLEGRDWIACADFTVADILMASVLRMIRKTALMQPFPQVQAYYERCFARPAWQRTLDAYAKRLRVNVDSIL